MGMAVRARMRANNLAQLFQTTWNLHYEMAGGVFAASHFLPGAPREARPSKPPGCLAAAVFGAQGRAPGGSEANRSAACKFCCATFSVQLNVV